jgi:hypothetical protein
MPPVVAARSIPQSHERHAEMENPATVVRQDQEYVQHLKANGWHGEEVDRYHGLEVILQEGPPRSATVACSLAILANTGPPMSMPSMSSSPWMRGAPQSGLSRLIWRIRFRASWETDGRPGWPRRTFQLHNTRNPLRCQWITVSGFTITRADRQPVQNRDKRARRKSIRSGQLGSLHRAPQNVELMAKSEHLHLKSGPSAEAIPQCCQNGH